MQRVALFLLKFLGILDPEPDETFTVTISNPSTTPAQTPPVSIIDTGTATGTITNDDTTITIADIGTAINEGEIANFTLSSITDPGSLNISYSVADVDRSASAGDFIAEADFTTTTPITFTDASGSGTWTGTLPIATTAIDRVDEPDGQIQVTLKAVTSGDGEYDINTNSNNHIGLVSVKDSTVPVITIANASTTLAGDDAVFILTSDIEPLDKTFNVSYIPSESRNNFLDVSAKAAGMTRTPSVTFDDDNGPWEASFDVTTREDPNNMIRDGEITITLQDDVDPKNYTLEFASDPTATSHIATAFVKVKPTISVAATNPSVNEGSAVQFTFTASDAVAENFEVNITLTESGGGSFLTTNPANETTVLLGAGTSHTESYTTRDNDSELNPNSVVTLTIETGTTYKVGTAFASVNVFDQSTPTDGISVTAISGPVTENGTNSTQVEFQIKAPQTSDASAARTINIAVDDGDADFLDSTSRARNQVTIPRGARSKNLSLTIVGDNTFEIHGEVTVEIKDAGGTSSDYSVAGSNKKAGVKVYDDDFTGTDPDDSVAIFRVKSTVNETAGVAPFLVVAKAVNTTDVRTIDVEIGDGTGDFLAASNADGSTVMVDIPVGALAAELNLALDNDNKYEAAGTITATIVAKPSVYSIATIPYNEASIGVTSDDPEVALPVISISSDAEMTGVTEGYSFDFEIESDIDLPGTPPNPLLVSFTVTDASTGAMVEGTTVTIQGDSRTATGTVSGIGEVTADTDITIAIADGTLYNVHGSDGSITVKVKDNDNASEARPSVKISSANYIGDGDDYYLYCRCITYSN